MKILRTHQGNPCKKGHDGLRYSSGHCVECSKIQAEKYREKNRDRYLEIRKNFYERHKERILKEIAEYKKTDVGALKARLRSAKRRQIERAGKVDAKEIKRLFDLQKGLCVVCKTYMTKYHVDHIVPLSKGGAHDFFNIQLLCQGCNQTKSNKDPIDFMQSKGYLL